VSPPHHSTGLISGFDSLCVNLSTPSEADEIGDCVKGNAVDRPIPTSRPLENNNGGHTSADDTLLLHATHHAGASAIIPQAPQRHAGLGGSANGGPAADDQRETTRSWSLSQFTAHHERINDICLGRGDSAAKRVHTQDLLAQMDGVLATLHPTNGPSIHQSRNGRNRTTSVLPCNNSPRKELAG
jgi:hypothetical protein